MSESLSWFDTKILECPMCLSWITKPLMQCQSGHLICSTCEPKMNDKCPQCRISLVDNLSRNIFLEQVAHDVSLECPHDSCKAMVKHSDMQNHFDTECEGTKIKCGYCNDSTHPANMFRHFRLDHKMPLYEVSDRAQLNLQMRNRDFQKFQTRWNYMFLINFYKRGVTYPMLAIMSFKSNIKGAFGIRVQMLKEIPHRIQFYLNIRLPGGKTYVQKTEPVISYHRTHRFPSLSFAKQVVRRTDLNKSYSLYFTVLDESDSDDSSSSDDSDSES